MVDDVKRHRFEGNVFISISQVAKVRKLAPAGGGVRGV
jgi:hypothetical protein